MFQSLFPSRIWDNTFHTLFMFQFILNGHVLSRTVTLCACVCCAPIFIYCYSLSTILFGVYDIKSVHFHATFTIFKRATLVLQYLNVLRICFHTIFHSDCIAVRLLPNQHYISVLYVSYFVRIFILVPSTVMPYMSIRNAFEIIVTQTLN